jgi:eukaryotic-like serine/threonine-protein kinase
LDSVRWQRVQTLFHDAADLPQSQQSTFLQNACGDDAELISEVLAMLAHDAQGSSLLDRGLAEVAHQALDVPASLVFKEFGPYRILKLLGEGGMGVVYLAQRKDLGTEVAIKFLRDAWFSPLRRERFAQEQRTLAQMNHPSIARLYDASTLDDGTPWFAMEYVDGLPLAEYCRQNRCPIEVRLQLFRSVCEAVQYAHGHAVIHRDLKPSNILVKEDSSVRLLDFGIAKQVESFDAPIHQTMPGLRLLTLAYAAPEQIRGERAEVNIDVYSLGVILYELLTGRLPFDLLNLTPAEAATVIAECEPARPSVAGKSDVDSEGKRLGFPLNKRAWADLDVLCLTAMHKDPQRRYRSVEALIRDLDHYLKGEPLEARPESLRYRAGKFVTRNWRALSAAGAVLIVIIGLVTYFTLRLARARDMAMAEAARTQRIQQFMANLFQGGDEAAGPSDSLRVVTMLDRGVQEAKSLNSDPKVQAELYQNLGLVYQKLGKLDQADTLLNAALGQRKRVFGADSAEAGESLAAQGLLRRDQARLDEAEALVRQALAMEQRHLPPDHPAIAKAQLAVGRVLADRGSYDQAIKALNESVRIESGPGAAPMDLAASLSALAEAQYLAGHYEISGSLYNRLLGMHRQLYGDRHPSVAEDLESLGAVQQDLGYYAVAEKFDRQALAITESYYGTDHPRTATDLTALGRALLYQKKWDEAAGVLQQALTIQQHVLGPVHPSVAKTLNELGNLASGQDRLDEAEARFRQVVEIYRTIYGEHHYLYAIALSNLASIYTDRKEYSRAEPLFRDAVRCFTETLSADNVNTGIAHIKLGRTLLRQKHYQDAEKETFAGYEVLNKQANPSVSFLHSARKDLAAEYEALGQPENAAKFRIELPVSGAKAASSK